MAETDGGSAAPSPPQQRRVPPMIALPPQSSFETLSSDDMDSRSLSQLLAGAIASPATDSEKKGGGFKQNRPMEVIAQSPSSVFSPSGFLSSPLQSPFGMMSHQQALAQVTAQAALSQSYFNHIQPADEQPQMVNAVNAKSDLDDSQIGSPVDVTEPQQMVSVYADTNDGYNWRKYGQKQVKASENPRSYYKCTYVNCPVKKKVGQSLDGHVNDIVYKGQHNHDPPQPNKRTKEGAHVNNPDNSQLEKPVADHGSNQLMRIDQGFNQLTIDDSDDEPNPKRRNTEVRPVSAPVESTLSNKMVSEPKFVVQTRSEVDLLDDGFKWRKYGQKVVKGNTNPRMQCEKACRKSSIRPEICSNNVRRET